MFELLWGRVRAKRGEEGRGGERRGGEEVYKHPLVNALNYQFTLNKFASLLSLHVE